MRGIMGVLHMRESLSEGVSARFRMMTRALGNGKRGGMEMSDGEMGKGGAKPPTSSGGGAGGKTIPKDTAGAPARPLGHSGGAAPDKNASLPPTGSESFTHGKAGKG